MRCLYNTAFHSRGTDHQQSTQSPDEFTTREPNTGRNASDEQVCCEGRFFVSAAKRMQGSEDHTLEGI